MAALAIVAVYGLNLGVDFKGGSVLEVQFMEKQPSREELSRALGTLDFIREPSVQTTQDGGALMRFAELNEEQHQQILSELEKNFGDLEEKRFDSVGPVVSSDLKRKSVTALAVLFIVIVIYILFVFRKLGGILSPWAMGGAALLALVHDLSIPAGTFALLGRYSGVEISVVFVAAALTILGYSVSDSVVIFDRVRENVFRYGRQNFSELVHKSIMQTLTRSINTSLSTILPLIAIYFFGGESVRMFSLALMIGIFLGAYSSIFIASPLIVWWSKERINR